ncbi:hypothetical protein [Enterococcus sp. CWB-B31]|uniref:hypothetical protein n=1 Tax=Enterococcus sp. CWB-B31 TaxID=2885159 RepID=UPI001E46E9A1|nr:hypothetical protein [Enterococcus sp. CWB-B31]MCB5955084.1 hypothetical protein [Enterococcus sp. CWB-B31]
MFDYYNMAITIYSEITKELKISQYEINDSQPEETVTYTIKMVDTNQLKLLEITRFLLFNTVTN